MLPVLNVTKIYMMFLYLQMANGLWNEMEKLQTNRHQNIVTCYRFMISPQYQNICYLFLEFMDKV